MTPATQWEIWATNEMIFPETILFEVTNKCNSKCNMCPVPVAKRPKTDMPLELVKKCIDDCVAFKHHVTRILFHQNGEPLLWGVDKLVDVINYASQRVGFSRMQHLGFFTNGSLLTEEATDKLLASDINFMAISFDGGTKEIYEHIRQGLNFDTTYRNIMYIAKRKVETGKKMFLQTLMVPQKDNWSTLQEYYSLFRGVPGIDDVGISDLCNYGGQVETDSKRIRVQYTPGNSSLPCCRLWTFLIVGSNGKPLLCCNDVEQPYDLGDLRTQTMQEVWQGKPFKDLREKHIHKDQKSMHLCSTCDWMNGFQAPPWWYKDGYKKIF